MKKGFLNDDSFSDSKVVKASLMKSWIMRKNKGTACQEIYSILIKAYKNFLYAWIEFKTFTDLGYEVF
jgi:hypothetical protein